MIRRVLIAAFAAISLFSTPSLAGQYTSAVAAECGLQGRVLWCAGDNLWSLDTREKVADIINHCKRANINTLVLDTKLIPGSVVYNSCIAPKLREWKDKPYPRDYDVLRILVDECHRAGIEIYAGINTFSEGTIKNGGYGPAYDHPNWQCIKYSFDRWVVAPNCDAYPIGSMDRMPFPGRLGLITKSKSLPAEALAGSLYVAVDSNGTIISSIYGQVPGIPGDGYVLIASGAAERWLRSYACVGSKLTLEARPRFVPVGEAADEHNAVFVNPADPEVRAYELSIIREIVSNYNVDGIVFDRMRYPSIYSDFSNISRIAFEGWLGKKIEHFPQDIYCI